MNNDKETEIVNTCDNCGMEINACRIPCQHCGFINGC